MLANRAALDAQCFELQDNGDGTVIFVNVAYPNLALTAAEEDWGGRITAARSAGGANQQWRLDDIGDGVLHVWLGTSSWLLDISGMSAQPGAGCVLWQDNGTGVQHWRLEQVDPHERDIICIGDSFLAGYAPEGTQIDWGTVVGSTIGNPTYRYHDGGSGFSARGKTGYTFGTLADKAHAEHTTASLVLVGGGYNDHMAGASSSALQAAAVQFARKITSYWPNAEVFVFVNLWGNGKNTKLGNAHTTAADVRASAIKAGIESVGNPHIHVLATCWTWIYTGEGLVSSDNIHPLTAGHTIIASHMLDFIMSGSSSTGGSGSGSGSGTGGETPTGGETGGGTGTGVDDPQDPGGSGQGSDTETLEDKFVWPAGGVTVSLDFTVPGNAPTQACIDGWTAPLAVDDSGRASITIPSPGAKIITLATYNMASSDQNDMYPTHLYVWSFQFDTAQQSYVAARIEGLDDMLQYAGCSIRIVGEKGIRMITGVPQSTRSALIGSGVTFGGKTWKLEEYGTVIAFDSVLNGADVTRDNTRFQNYAYSKTNGKDPIFSQSDGVTKYTNVLTGFTNDQCAESIAMRPYLVLKARDGETVTIYGGTVHRSIGYIAWQNRNAFDSGTAAYAYVWGIIHYVYGDQFDADFEG